jgi:peptide/nickel transport system permease protein
VSLAIVFALVNLVVDIVYAFIDPRIKAQYEGMSKTRTNGAPAKGK